MRTQSRRSRMGCTAAGGLLLALIVLAGSGWIRYRNTAGVPGGVPIRVKIIDPISGATFPSGAPLIVQASALGRQPLTSLELWADGSLVGVQSVESLSGGTWQSAEFVWPVGAPGTYTLIVRAIDQDGQAGASQSVLVHLEPQEKHGGPDGGGNPADVFPIVSGSGAPPPDAQDAIPLPGPPNPPQSGDQVGPAGPWEATLGAWLASLFASNPPAAPELTASVAGCDIQLGLHDLSSNEDGFFIYRQSPAAPQWETIGTLDAQSDVDWITLTDADLNSGQVSYYAASFNSQGEAAGNIVAALVDPGACPTGLGGENDLALSIRLTGLQSEASADQVYCYRSLGGVYWSRWPLDGFFEPGPEGFDLHEQADVFLKQGFGGGPLSFDLECWGWVGGVLQLLGKLHYDDINAPGLGDLELANAGLLADLNVGEYKPLDGDPPPKAPLDPQMPTILALALFNTDACLEHTPSGGSNVLENLLFCTWFPEYDQYTQPYMVWYVNDGHCPAGDGPDCHTLSWYKTRAKLYGGIVGFRIFGHVCDTCPVEVFPPDLTAYVIPPASECGLGLDLRVRMFFQGGPGDPDYAGMLVDGPDSNKVYASDFCPPSYTLNDAVELDVNFKELDIWDPDDGIDHDLEVYGHFAVETWRLEPPDDSAFPSVGLPGLDDGGSKFSTDFLKLGRDGWSEGTSSECDTEEIELGIEAHGAGGCPELIVFGKFQLNDLMLCSSSTYKKCEGPFTTGNNHIKITVEDGMAVKLRVRLLDYDTQSADDEICADETWVELNGEKSLSLLTWAGIDSDFQLSQGDNGHASCDVFVNVKAIGQ